MFVNIEAEHDVCFHLTPNCNNLRAEFATVTTLNNTYNTLYHWYSLLNAHTIYDLGSDIDVFNLF